MPKSFEIAIVGGGIAGLTLAIALHRRNIAVQVYEQTAHFKEIGAGVSFSPNAIAAMELCDGELDDSFGPGVKSAFDKVSTTNGWPSKQAVWFDYYDGMAPEQRDEILFSITSSCGQQGVHRAHFLDELVNAFPEEKTHLGKRLENVIEREDGRLGLAFTDGTSAEADAIIGCDGIHSRVRSFVVGENHPSANPSYSYKYAYRGITPMETAIEAIGEEKARNSCMFLGKSGHVLTFPMDGGKFLNMVAFYQDKNDWTDDRKLTKMSTREDALNDFKDFGPDVTKIMSLVQPQLPIWAIFDFCDNPLPIFFKGRIAVIGDAAHATSPHHGSGAGFAIEDSALIAELLADERVRTPRDIEAALATYDEVRRGRDQWLVESSRFVGELDAGLVPEIGTDYNKVHQEIKDRYSKIIEFSPKEEATNAKKVMHEKLALAQK